MVIPKQAAILCGGLGVRLRPITDKIPKPMILVNERPFLEYLLKQLKDNGIQEVILMTGYLGEQIQNYFKDGGSLGLSIRYSHGTAQWDTGRRLYETKELLDDYFLLLYSDNFVQFNLKIMAGFYHKKNKLISFIVHQKSSGNIRLAADGLVEVYDKTRSAENLDFVELGYMMVNKKIFEYYDDIDISFSDIISKLVSNCEVAGMIVKDTYYSISDLDRLKLTQEYLKVKKILLIDRDGVINKKAPRGEYINSWDEFFFISENSDGMCELSKAGFSFIIISNQAGVGRGMVSIESVNYINQRMIQILEEKKIGILAIYVCPHHWEENCQCRKPAPGLFFRASQDWLFRLDKAYYIGDDLRDCQAAYNAGCKCIYVGDDIDLHGLLPEEQPQWIVNNLKEVLPYLVKT